jgi:hypothetical protein
MKLWRLLPTGRDRSPNWRRSLYDGTLGAVIVRAPSAREARAVVAREFEQEAASAGDALNNPWMLEDDTTVEPCADEPFSPHGEAQVLRPTRETVIAPRSG